MNLKCKLILFALLLVNIQLFAQEYQLSGTVTDETNSPVPGANIIVDGTTRGTQSDFDGNFQINVSNGETLVVSYLGYVTQSVAITGQSEVNVQLTEDTSQLEEVVVIGYGTRKKSSLTGAVAKVQGGEIASIQAQRVDEALGGKAAGVLIQNQDGAPGADPKIQIRAASSINGNSNPLIVVDGYPISGSLATVNPNDIQSVEVLKDAASAAIYGSRGANGVILVTTKKGRTGEATFSYNSYVSTSSRYLRDNIKTTSGDYYQIATNNINNGTFNVSDLDPAIVSYRLNGFRDSPDVVGVEDWFFRNGFSTNHDLSISGGSEKVNYFASLGYLNTDGVAITQGFERANVRLNLDAKLGEKFSAGINFNGFASDRDIVGHDMRDLLRAYSVHPIYHTDASIAFVQSLDQQAQALGLSSFDSGFRGGSDAPWNSSIYTLEPGMTAQDWHYGRSGNGIGGSGDAGPATKLDNTDRYQKTYFGNVTSYLQYEILDGLNVKTVLGADIRDTQDYFWRGLEFDSRARSTQTALDQTDVQRSSILSETTLNSAYIISEDRASSTLTVDRLW